MTFCKDKIKFIDNIKEFYDCYEYFQSWLDAKERMFEVLGPISSDSRIVSTQVQQVKVLREEFRTQQPQMNHFLFLGESLVAKMSPELKNNLHIEHELKSVIQRWTDQLKCLDERAQSLGDAVDTSREFNAIHNRLYTALQGISDNLEEFLLEYDLEENLRKIKNLERQLEGQKSLLADAESAGTELCQLLNDNGSKSEIQGKLTNLEKMYTSLQKKIDHKKAEIDINLRDERQFEATCTKTLGWINNEVGNISKKLLISADRNILQQQIDNHEVKTDLFYLCL